MADISELKNKSTETGSDQAFTGDAAQIIKTDASGLVDPSFLAAAASMPVVGGAIAMGVITGQVATATWPAATDANTIATSIKYRVCLSDVAVTSLNEARQLGEWQSRWSRDLTTIDVQGLFPSRNYFVTVFVKGHDDQAEIYTSVMFTTIASAVATYYASDDFFVTTDNGGVGDIVTYDNGGTHQAAGLIRGTDAFNTITEAVAAANGNGVETVIYMDSAYELTTTLAPSDGAGLHIIGTNGAAKIERNTGFLTDSLINPTAGALTLVNLTFDNKHLRSATGSTYTVRGTNFAPLNMYNCAVINSHLNVTQGQNTPPDFPASTNLSGLVSDTTIDGKYVADRAEVEARLDNIETHLDVIGATATNVPLYEGRAILSFGGTMTISNCRVENFGRLGIWCFNGIDSIVRWNTVIGSDGDMLNYGAAVQGGASATITENRFYNFDGHAFSDGIDSISAAIVQFADAAGSTILYNEFISSKLTIQIAGGTSTITGNTFSGCDVGLINYTATVLDATNNYWGTPSLNEADVQGAADVEPKATSHKIDV